MTRLSAMLAALIVASPVAAQEFHLGLSGDYALPHSGEDQYAVSFIGGVMYRVDALRFGLELDLGLPLAGQTDVETGRFRILTSYDVGDYAVLAGAGVSEYSTIVGSAGGENYSIGVERDWSERVTLRGEIIRDFMSSTVPDTTITRLGLIYKF